MKTIFVVMDDESPVCATLSCEHADRIVETINDHHRLDYFQQELEQTARHATTGNHTFYSKFTNTTVTWAQELEAMEALAACPEDVLADKLREVYGFTVLTSPAYYDEVPYEEGQ